MERTVKTGDGRILAVTEGGDPHGLRVPAHMGTPNSRLLYGPMADDAARRGLRLISYDRPGYGGSTAQPGRTVADCAADVEEICAELDIDRLATWVSRAAGRTCWPARRCCPAWWWRRPHWPRPRPTAPTGWTTSPAWARINVEDIMLTLSDPKAAREKLEHDREEFLAATVEQLAHA